MRNEGRDIVKHFNQTDGSAVRVEEIIAREVFECHLEMKAAEDAGEGERLIEGYASTKDLDRYSDIIEPSAFKKSLRPFVKNGVILLHHFPALAAGVPVEASIDDKGLYIKARIGFGPQYVEDAWSLIEQKILKAFSVGFSIPKDGVEMTDEEDPVTGWKIRIIKKLELLETSIVSIGANRPSLFSLTKGFLTGSDLTGKRPAWYEPNRNVEDEAFVRQCLLSGESPLAARKTVEDEQRRIAKVSKRGSAEDHAYDEVFELANSVTLETKLALASISARSATREIERVL